LASARRRAAALRRALVRDDGNRPRDRADLDELREIHGELPIDPLPGLDGA